MSDAVMTRLWTVEEAAEFLRVSVAHVQRQARKGKIPGAQKVGYLWRFNRTALEQWFAVGCRPEEVQQ